MAQERDNLLRIRAKVDQYDELEERELGEPEPIPLDSSRTRLGSPCPPTRVSGFLRLITTAEEDLPVQQFTKKLAGFLRLLSSERCSEKQLQMQMVCRLPYFESKLMCWNRIDMSILCASHIVYMSHEFYSQARHSPSNT